VPASVGRFHAGLDRDGQAAGQVPWVGNGWSVVRSSGVSGRSGTPAPGSGPRATWIPSRLSRKHRQRLRIRVRQGARNRRRRAGLVRPSGPQSGVRQAPGAPPRFHPDIPSALRVLADPEPGGSRSAPRGAGRSWGRASCPRQQRSGSPGRGGWSGARSVPPVSGQVEPGFP